jgi:ABC-type dipeptide/oligopeptide/nickel transport system permease component
MTKQARAMNNNHIIGVFDDEDTLMAAIHEVKDKGYEINEVYTPYPVHEVIEAMGHKTRFTIAAFLYGLFGALGVLAFMYYTAVIDWPINYGGKPTNAFPSFIIVAIVITILTVTLASLFTFSIRSKVYPGKAYTLPDVRSTDDKFVIVFESAKVANDKIILESILRNKGAVEIYEKELHPQI